MKRNKQKAYRGSYTGLHDHFWGCPAGSVAGGRRVVSHTHISQQHLTIRAEEDVGSCVVWCGVCGCVWCGVAWCGVRSWCGVVWCGVVCGVRVVWCGVVWCVCPVEWTERKMWCVLTCSMCVVCVCYPQRWFIMHHHAA